ncbi:MAG: DEAD/DEAH box helicase [Wenzhouxiangella sp.]
MTTVPEISNRTLAALGCDALERGRMLHSNGAVGHLRIGQLDQAVVLSGLVDDNSDQPFNVYVTIEDDELEGDCTCRLGRCCEHMAALVLAAAAEGRSTIVTVAAREPAFEREHRGGSQSMVYLVRLSADGTELSVCPSRVSRSGEVPVTTPYSLSRLEDSRQPDYVRDSDLAILHALADRVGQAADLVWYPLGPASQALLREMIATKRCHWKTAEGPGLRLAEPIVATLEWELLDSGCQRPVLVTRDDQDGLQLPLLPPWRLNTESGRCRVLTTADDGLTARLLTDGPVPPEAVDEVIRQLEGTTSKEFPKPGQLQLHHLAPCKPVPRLQLINAEIGTGRRFETVPAARLSFVYGPVELAWDDEFSSRLTGDDQVGLVDRDHAFEEACAGRLEEARLAPVHACSGGDYRPGEGGYWVARQQRDSRAAWIGFQRGLHRLRRAGWQIEVASDFVLELIEPEGWYGDLVADPDRADFFDLDLGVEWRGQRISLLPALLAWVEHTPASMLQALLSGDHSDGEIIMALDQRRVVQMSIERLAATLRGLSDFLDAALKLKAGRLRLPRGRLAELSEAGKLWQLGGDEGLAELSRRLSDFDHIEALPAPEGMVVDLRPYQRFGLGWLQFLREFGFGGILADDMGLGKTVQTLAHLQAEKRAGRMNQPCLLVAPTSLMFNWRAEARRFAPELKVLMLHGPQRKGLFQWISDSDLVLTTYPLLPRDIEYLRPHQFHLLILDEAQAIKNPRARVSRVVRELQASHRLCLTGTPLENHLGELWSLFDFLMPGMLGTQTRFRRLFKNPIERQNDAERRDALARRIRPFFLRRTKAEVAPELPPKTEITRAVSLDGGQRRLYERARVALHDKVRRALNTDGAERSRIVVLDALLKLRQICCDPRLLKDVEGRVGAGSAKLELLMDLLPDMVAEGRRILLFSQFVTMLNLIEDELVRHGIEYVKLTGRTRDRQKVVERFQSGKVPLFLISLKAGGVGLNLTAADTVIHYDPWWNPAVEDQATDRAHRIGQDQKVFVYKLLTENTIEQKVFELQQSKRGLVEGLLGGGGATRLGADDLESLFEPLG